MLGEERNLLLIFPLYKQSCPTDTNHDEILYFEVIGAFVFCSFSGGWKLTTKPVLQALEHLQNEWSPPPPQKKKERETFNYIFEKQITFCDKKIPEITSKTFGCCPLLFTVVCFDICIFYFKKQKKGFHIFLQLCWKSAIIKKNIYTSLINLKPLPLKHVGNIALAMLFVASRGGGVIFCCPRSVGKPKVLQCMSVHFFLLNACSFFGSFRFGRGEDKSKYSLLFLLLFVASINKKHQDLHLNRT